MPKWPSKLIWFEGFMPTGRRSSYLLDGWMGTRTESDRHTEYTEEKKLIVPSQAVMNFMRPVHVGFMVDKVGRRGFSLSTLVFTWQHHSTNPSYRLIHLSLAVYFISNLQDCWLAHSGRCLWQPISKTSQHIMAGSCFSLVHSVLLKNIRK